MQTSSFRFLRAFRFTAGLFCLSLFLVPASMAQTVATHPTAWNQVTGPLGGLHWRMIGPFRGGRTIAVSGVEGQPSVFYFGGVGGGVWKSSNAGETWEPIFDKEPISSIGALVVAPSDPNIIYVGTGEADFRSNLTYGDRRLQIDKRGQDLVEYWADQFAAHCPYRGRSEESATCSGGSHGQRVRSRPGARHFSIQ